MDRSASPGQGNCSYAFLKRITSVFIKVLSQVYWPDDASTAQHLVDLCELLARRGARVEVITSRHKYEDNRVKYPRQETHNGVLIRRLNDFGLGKGTVIRRLLDFFSFNVLLFFRILFEAKPDMYLGMTSPPLVSFFGILVARLRGVKFCYWTMDLQPELSIRSGLIQRNSLSARLLTSIADSIFRRATKIIVLDKYMKTHVVQRGANESRVAEVPVWPVVGNRYHGHRLNNPFRVTHGFGDAFVVMYSGNHSYIHPLDTLLRAAVELKDCPSVLFAFIGGGIRAKDVTQYKNQYNLQSVVQLPYQPRESIHESLAAADVHVVIMGEDMVGYTHPNKIYGAMFVGKPIIYIGPTPSHVSDILERVQGNCICNHGEIEFLVQEIHRFTSMSASELDDIGKRNLEFAKSRFDPVKLKEQMASEVLNS